jgi:hypothetical protein
MVEAFDQRKPFIPVALPGRDEEPSLPDYFNDNALVHLDNTLEVKKLIESFLKSPEIN